MTRPLLSIIIPTRNRFFYLKSCVELILSFELKNTEIIVQDNSDNLDELNEYFNSLNNSSVKFFHTEGWISVIDNCDNAVRNSTGDYVCFIGDDDGIMPFLEKVVEWMRSNDIKLLRGVKPFYTWPGQKESFLSDKDNGVLKIDHFSYKVEYVNSNISLERTLKRGGTDMSSLPCLYHGIVKRNSLDKIYETTNSYFPGPSPDMSNAVALCLVEESHCIVGFPIVISGKSPQSTGGQGLLHKHVAEIGSVKHLPKDTEIQWSTSIPKYWTGPTIWAESVLKALKRMGYDKKWMAKFNITYLYAKIFVFDFNSRRQIFSNFSNRLYTPSFFYFIIQVLFSRALNIVLNKIAIRFSIKSDNVPDIKRAVELVIDNVDNKKTPF